MDAKQIVKRRRRQRGAAMTEMVICLPVMIAMWAGIDYFRSGYARRLDAIARSHKQAWELAYSNDGRCFANKEPWAGFTGENDVTNPANTGEKGAEASSQFKSTTSSSMFMYGHASASSSWSTKGAHWQDNAKGSVSGRTFIMCNEVVPDGGSDQDVLKPLWSFVRSLF